MTEAALLTLFERALLLCLLLALPPLLDRRAGRRLGGLAASPPWESVSLRRLRWRGSSPAWARWCC